MTARFIGHLPYQGLAVFTANGELALTRVRKVISVLLVAAMLQLDDSASSAEIWG